MRCLRQRGLESFRLATRPSSRLPVLPNRPRVTSTLTPIHTNTEIETLIKLMYCPKCATENIDSARFCRACRANLSLVPQALSGHVREETPDAEDAIKGARKRR